MDLKAPIWERAIHEIAAQGEKLDRDAIVSTFVDMGHLPRILNPTNQYIEGRRGSGKTHLLTYFCARVNGDFDSDRSIAIYIDARTINHESDTSLAPRFLAKSFYKEMMLKVASELEQFAKTHLWQNDVPTARTAFDTRTAEQTANCIRELRSLISLGAPRLAPGSTLKSKTDETVRQHASVEGELSASGNAPAQLGLKLAGGASHEVQTATEFGTTTEFTLPLVEVGKKIEEFLVLNDLTRCFIAIDEWSSITRKAQPFLADLLKRSIFPCTRVTTKISALPFQTNFSVTEDGQILGFERNGDIFSAIDLDEDLVFVTNADRCRKFLTILLHNHIRLALQRVAGEMPALPSDPNETVHALISDAAYDRLLAYAQGNARDFLTLFKLAAGNVADTDSDRVNVPEIEKAAKAFGVEKVESIKENADAFRALNSIISEVLHKRKHGAFLIDTEYSADEVLLFLIHNRLLHVAEKSYSAPRQVGKRFLVLCLDFCVVVDHLRAPTYKGIIGQVLELPFTIEQQKALEGLKDDEKKEAKLLNLEAPDKRIVRYTVLDPSYFRPQQRRKCPSCESNYAIDHPVVLRMKVCPNCAEPIAEVGQG